MNYLEMAGTLIGLVYLWLEYRASSWLWLASIIMPAVYIAVYYRAGLYADFGINIYYVLASIYGWFCWQIGRKRAEGKPAGELPIRHTPRKLYPFLTLITVVLTAVIAQILLHLTDSNVPWADSFTTALSMVALWMLARKYVEQWLAWMGVDVVCAVLYVYKELYFTAGLYALYSVIAVFGYLKWKKMIQASAR